MTRSQYFQIATYLSTVAGTKTADSTQRLAGTTPGPLCCHSFANRLIVSHISRTNSSGCITASGTSHPCSSIPNSRTRWSRTMANSLDFRTCTAFGSRRCSPASYTYQAAA